MIVNLFVLSKEYLNLRIMEQLNCLVERSFKAVEIGDFPSVTQ